MMCETYYVLFVLPHLIGSKSCSCFPLVQRIHKIDILHHKDQLRLVNLKGDICCLGGSQNSN
jgi:hypothetical protein